MNKLAERAYAQVAKAERLKSRVNNLKQESGAFFVTASYVLDWETATVEATHLCRLACDLLPQTDLTALKQRIEADEEGLWDNYTLAEWPEEGHIPAI